jgi:hypothetical protein
MNSRRYKKDDWSRHHPWQSTRVRPKITHPERLRARNFNPIYSARGQNRKVPQKHIQSENSQEQTYPPRSDTSGGAISAKCTAAMSY